MRSIRLFIVGASAPEQLSRLCRGRALPHVFIDQPCADAPSVVSDNYAGAAELTRLILRTVPQGRRLGPSGVVFLGGNAALPASSRRIAGFRDVMMQEAGGVQDDQIIACSYDPDRAHDELARLCDRLGHLPAGLLINSITAFEGALRFLVRLSEAEVRTCTLGCYDYDPFGALLRFPLHMVRQRHRTLVRRAYQMLDDGATGPILETVHPELCPAPARD